jgi:serine/threonine protein kinase
MRGDLDLQPGDRYGPFEVVELLGTGGFAKVYRVRHPDLPNDGALKLSRLPVYDGVEAQRALREVEILRTLTNPHVVRIHDAGRSHDGRVFILMEFLDGMQLDAFHDFDQPMPVAQAIWVVHQACLGLAEAHAHGVVHRDIKPENLWVEPDHNVKVIDFGLARAFNESTAMGANVTMGHFLIGTPHYAQPEQLETQKLTPASDVYSLGTILYELLSGHCVFFQNMPWSGTRESLRDNPVLWIEAHSRRDPVPLHHYPHCRDVPSSLAELVYRCLEKDPLLRPRSAGDLSTALGEIMHYDLGMVTGATVRVIHPYGGYEDLLVLPGSHRIGSSSECEIRLPPSRAKPLHAVLEWAGLPEYPLLRSLQDDGSVRVNGQPIERTRALGPHDTIQVGDYVLSLEYPSV